MKRSVRIQVGNLTFLCKLCPPGFKKQLCTSTTSTANLKQHSASLSRYVRVNKKSKDMATASQNRSSTTQITITAYSSLSLRCLHLPAAAGQPGFAVYCGRAVVPVLKLIELLLSVVLYGLWQSFCKIRARSNILKKQRTSSFLEQ